MVDRVAYFTQRLAVLLLVVLASTVQAKVSTKSSVVSAYLTPDGKQLEVAYKEVTSDYRCPLIGHGCTDMPISALLYGQVLPLELGGTLMLPEEGRYVLRKEVSDASFNYSLWRGQTLLRTEWGDVETLTACHSAAPDEKCVYAKNKAPRVLDELFAASSPSRDGTLLFTGGSLYTLPDLQVVVEVDAGEGYPAFLEELRKQFDTGMTWRDIRQVPLNTNQILGMPDYTEPARTTLAYLYDIEADTFTAVPLDLTRLRERFPEGRMGLEIRDFVYRPQGITFFAEVLLYGVAEKAPRHYVVVDSATGAFAELPLEKISPLDFHLLDTEQSRLVIVNRHIEEGVQVRLLPYRL